MSGATIIAQHIATTTMLEGERRRNRTQSHSGAVFTGDGDPVQPQPELKPWIRKMPPHFLSPSVIHTGNTNVYALEEGILKYRGRIWEVDDSTHGPGWMALPKGLEQPDHFSPRCQGGSQDTAIDRCLTGGTP
jgi:hypothetical protein